MAPKIGDAFRKVAVIPNGVYSWDGSSMVEPHPKLSHIGNRKVLLFLSRVHKIKGILDLINVWRKICVEYPDWHLAVVGQIDQGVRAAVENTSKDTQLAQSITFTEPIYGHTRAQVFTKAEAFVLPSYGEGLPTALLEALSCNLPVIYTDECNFPSAENCGAGFRGPAGESNLETNLRRLLNLSDKDRIAMGEKGAEMIRSQFLWDKIAEKWISVYRNIIHETR
jgi:poly(glycerol-phosphate) alpha-glucosyltransferase